MPNLFYVFVEAVRATYRAGGVAMLPIILAGTVGFHFVFRSWIRIGGDFFRKDVGSVVEALESDLKGAEGRKTALRRLRRRGGIVARELRLALQVACDRPAEYRDYMQVRMIRTMRYMERGNDIVRTMAAAAPLLGLLGTVTGMVATFDVITLYGNQNPVLMADGISEALISTQSGLLIAFPLTLLRQRLEERIEYLGQQIALGVTVIENLAGRG